MVGFILGSFRAIGRPMLLALGFAFLLACLGADDAQAQRRKGGNEAPAVTFVEVKMEKLNERVAAVGSGRARQQVTLTTRVAGVIAEVLF